MNALDDVIDSVHAYVTRGLEDHAPAADGKRRAYRGWR